MEYLIYGINRVQRDFEYMFNDIEINGYIIDDVDISQYNDKPVYHANHLGKCFDKKIIVCDFDYQSKAEYLNSIGLKYEKDFVMAHDLFGKLDEALKKTIESRNLIIFGTGKRAEELSDDVFLRDNISLYIDNDSSKIGSSFHRIIICNPTDYINKREKNDLIIIATDAYWEIKKQLTSYGLDEGKDFIWYKTIVNRPSNLLKRTIYDQSYFELVCDTMLNTFEVESTGEVACCCTTFIEERIGNLIWQEYDDIWFSNLHRILCLSALNHTYTFCKKDMCPVLIPKNSEKYNNEKYIGEYKRIKENPKVMLISIDSTCNLYCKSCRDEICVLKGNELKKAEIMAEKLLENNNFDNAEFIVMAGNGEVFLSKTYEKIWSSEKTKKAGRFRLLSNGTVFTPERWKLFSQDRKSEIVVTFSIDAASDKTYSMLRRGGNFQQLLKNLEFASKLRKNGEISYFQISFVVQRLNYREMPDFVELGKRLGVDKVFFTRILNWGTYSEDQFRNIAMTDDDGHANYELQKILDMPIMSERIVDLGTINTSKHHKEYGYINNYYMWEIDEYLKGGESKR